MSKIKSAKAKNHIEKWQWQSKGGTFDNSPIILRSIAEDAVIIAETEAEERHAKAMQELKDKAVAEYKKCCPFIGSTNNCTKGDTDCDWKCPRPHCEFISLFTQKLNEQ